MLYIKTFTFNPLEECCHVVRDGTGECAIVDPGCCREGEVSALEDYIDGNGLRVKAIWLTHGHFDHIFGVKALLESFRHGDGSSIPVFMNPSDRVILENAGNMSSIFGLHVEDAGFGTVDINDGDELKLGDSSFRVIGTPGHTPGGVCFYSPADKVLFSGDTLFAGSIGRTDLPFGDYDSMIVAIMEKLIVLPGDVRVFPGHGPSTEISIERTHNPFLQPFNEPDSDHIDWDIPGIELNRDI